MPWLKLNITTTAEFAEDIADALTELNASAVSFEDAADQAMFQLQPQETPLWNHIQINALFLPDTKIEPIIHLINKTFPDIAPLQYKTELLADKDWVRITQQTFKPLCYAEKLWVCPPWCDDTTLHGTIVTIDPGLAFGTGTHPTTALCLTWLANHPPQAEIVIDYGCGSGILALAALALGAKKVIACDHDEQAIQSTKNNAELNTFATKDKIEILLPQEMRDIKVSLLIANILANPLIVLANKISNFVQPGGTLILSGLLAEETERVVAAYADNFQLINKRTQEEWALLELKKQR